MREYQDPELLRLFTVYTGAPDSLTVRLTEAVAERGRHDPLIVATRSDIALYPGNGRPPTVEGTRLSTRGFKELAGVSILTPICKTCDALRVCCPKAVCYSLVFRSARMNWSGISTAYMADGVCH